MPGSPLTGKVRKIHAAGRSAAVILPPIVLENLHSAVGDYLYMDITQPDFCILSKAPIPVDITHPELFSQPQEQTPGTEPPPPPDTPTDGGDLPV